MAGMRRREFIRNMAGAGAGLAVSGIVPGFGSVITHASGTGYRVQVAGGFAKEKSPGFVRIHALSLQPSFRLKSEGFQGDHLKVEIVNIWGNLLDVSGDGIENQKVEEKQITFEVPSKKLDKLTVSTRFKGDISKGFSFIAVSDTHLGDPMAEKNFSVIQKNINGRRPLFVADAGDIIDVDEKPQWDVFDEKLKLFDVPFFGTIGNHDSYISTSLYRENLGDLFYSFEVGDSQFLFLDNAQKYNNATLYMTDGDRNAQWNWLKKELTRPAAHRFVFFHFPVYGKRSMEDPMYMQSTPPEKRKEEIRQMIAMFKEAGVNYILYGHIHSPDREIMDGIVHLRLGGGGGSKASHTSEEAVNFTQIFVDSQGVRDYTLHPFFSEGDITSIEFCELPKKIKSGAAITLAVNGKGDKKLYAIEPQIRVVNGKGSLSGNTLTATGAPGDIIEVEAEFNGMKTTGNLTIAGS